MGIPRGSKGINWDSKGIPMESLSIPVETMGQHGPPGAESTTLPLILESWILRWCHWPLWRPF
jgi:hypothetical protein